MCSENYTQTARDILILFLLDDNFNGYHPPASCKQFINVYVHQFAMDDDDLMMIYRESRKELVSTKSI